MSYPSWSWTLDRTIPSRTGAHREIIDEIIDRLSHESWSSHDVFSVRLALEEAIVNAIKHGNGLDQQKQVHICCKMSKQRIWVTVADEGSGFKPEQVPDPTDPANLEKPGGRGIMLMRNYMTR
jgi:serine/threonine-protein kinase RsbW